MNKPELIALMAQEANISKKAAGIALAALVTVAQNEIVDTGRFEVLGLGVFRVADRAASIRNHPQRPGERVAVPAKRVVKFRAAKPLKAAVNL